MAVSYPRNMREYAKKNGLSLATIAVSGVEFQGPIDRAEREELMRFVEAFFRRLCKTKPVEADPDA
jgi:hypothetical protein